MTVHENLRTHFWFDTKNEWPLIAGYSFSLHSLVADQFMHLGPLANHVNELRNYQKGAAIPIYKQNMSFLNDRSKKTAQTQPRRQTMLN